MKILFYGFGHGHIYSLYQKAAADPEIEIAACIEEDDEMATGAEEALGIKILRGGYDEWLATDIDAVAIGKAFTLRGEAAIKALRAGKHVIADKPLCTKLSEIDEIEKLSSQNGLQVACMLDLRYQPQALRATELMRELGEVRNITFTGQHFLCLQYRQKWYFNGFQGGTINDIAIHGVDLVRILTGHEFEKTNFARTWNAYAGEYPDFNDCAVFAAQLDNGCQVMADISYSAPAMVGCMDTYWNFKFWCEKGMLTFCFNKPGVTVYKMDGQEPEYFDGIESGTDYLCDFKKSIADGGDSITKSVIASARSVLLIQHEADK
ncbi:MAG: Gfo/Idh/MocA family oxidoreductase [Ruminococcaceae bacterium]|nr:Gfo/Idh/MocA family oxidoreductase [Oscillospiraceae bacterium]